eukprot:COSAG02_NODE_458_length_21942_cov_1643.812068_10_plen_63_part_00
MDVVRNVVRSNSMLLTHQATIDREARPSILLVLGNRTQEPGIESNTAHGPADSVLASDVSPT